MTLEPQSANKALHAWYVDLVTHFRTEYSRLPEEEKKHGIDTNANYSSPCQIEVFWLKDPELQLNFKSNFRNRHDMEVIIHGPFDSHEFVRKVEPILNEPRWAETRIGDRWRLGDNHRTMAYLLASQLRRLIELAKVLHFDPKVKQGRGWGQLVGDHTWVDVYFGNIGNSDFVTVANEKLQETRRRAQDLKKNAEEKKPEIRPSIPKPQNPKGYGVYFFPPIIMGRRPDLTPVDILYGRSNRVHTDLLMDGGINLQFGKYAAVASEDGFIILPIGNKETALKAMNVIMAVGMLRGFEFLAVREHELSEVEFNRETMRVGGMTYDPEATMRTRLFLERFGQGTEQKRRELDENTIRNIVAEAGNIFDQGRYVEELRLLSESFTHLKDAEYAPSFVMSWSIIERHISKRWKKKLEERELDEERTGKLLDTSRWSADYLLEVLNINNDITEDEYDRFMEMKHKRNGFIHKGKQVVREDAERCFNISKEIVVRKVFTN